MRVLVTGFTPYAHWGTNSSQRAVEALARRPPPGVDLQTMVLPVVFGDAWLQLCRRVEGDAAQGRPLDVLVLVGMAVGAVDVWLERWAFNLVDTEHVGPRRPDGRGRPPLPDNAGQTPIDRPIVEGGPLALASTIDVKGLARELVRAGHPVEVSTSPGTYVCNDLYYRALDGLSRMERAPACLFVHVPSLPRWGPVRLLGIRVPFLRRAVHPGMKLGRIVAVLRSLARRVGQHVADGRRPWAAPDAAHPIH